MLCIEVEDSKIKSIFSGKMPDSTGRDLRQVPMMFPGIVGQDIREFSPEWELLPLEDRLRMKLVPDAERYKAMGEELVPKTPEELARDGLEPAPKGLKLDPAAPIDAPRFVPMSREELVEAGELARAEADKLNLKDEEERLLSRLASTDWYVARFAETGEAIPEAIKTERAAARERISAIRDSL